MQVTETLSDGLKREFTVVVPETEISDKREKRLAELSKTMQLPGFRPGKVPMSMLRKRYGEAVTAEVMEDVLNDASDRVLNERNLRPAMQPRLEVIKPGRDSDLEFTLQMEILPEIELPALADVTIKKLVASVSEEEIVKSLERLQQQRRRFAPAEPPRPAEKGDQLKVDFIGRIDGEAFAGGTASDVAVVVAGEGFIPGFSEQLEGVNVGETRTIKVSFPADYHAKELAGKDAEFEVTIKEVNVPNLPPLDEEFAKSLGYDTLEALKQAISDETGREYEQMSRIKQKRALLDLLAEQARFTPPESLVEAEFAEIWREFEAQKAAGRLDDEDKAKDEEILKADYRRIAERRVRLGLVLAEVGRTEQITVTEAELRQAMFAEAMKYRDQALQVLEFFKKNPKMMERFRGPIFEDKVIDHLLGQVRLEEVSVTPEELAAEEEA